MKNEVNTDYVFSIMISTDNHCGYKDNDKTFGEDSFRAFEEVLENTTKYDCDILLLGGDLYHEKVPTKTTGLNINN